METVYVRIHWQNQPSTATALGATNLNKIDLALSIIDGRVVGLATTKLDMDTANGMVQDVTLNENGVFTIKKLDGSTTTYDTKLEKLAVNFEYDPVTQQLVITLDDGTKQYVDMSSLITEYEFEDSSTIAFSVDQGKVSASVKNGSITSEKLQPDYLADVTVQVQNAYNAAEQSIEYADLSKRYAVGGIVTEDEFDNAKYYMEQARIARDQAEDISNVGIATEVNLGLVKGGGNVKVEEDGNMNVELPDNLAYIDGSALKDKEDNEIFPLTKESQVVDENNTPLDVKLKQFYSLQGGTEITEGADLNNSIYLQIGNYYCKSIAIASTVLNMPPVENAGAFTMRVYLGTGENYPTQEIRINGSVNNYVRYSDPYTNTYSTWRKSLSTADLTSSDTVGGMDKAFSAEGGKVHGQEIDALNLNLGTKSTFKNYTLAPQSEMTFKFPINGFFLIGTNIDGLLDAISFAICFGGSTGNASLTTKLTMLSTATQITYTVGNTAGNYDRVTIKNTNSIYTAKLNITDLSGVSHIVI